MVRMKSRSEVIHCRVPTTSARGSGHAAHAPGWSVGSGLALGKKACSAFLQHDVTLWEFPGQFQFLVKIIGPMCKMLFER